MPTKKQADTDGIQHLQWAYVKTGLLIEDSDRRYFIYEPNII